MLDDLMGFTSQFMGYIFKIKIEMHKFHTIICYSFMNFGRKYTLVFWWTETSLWCPCVSMNWNILVVSLWFNELKHPCGVLVVRWIETSLWCPCGSMNWNILVVSLWLQRASYKIHGLKTISGALWWMFYYFS